MNKYVDRVNELVTLSFTADNEEKSWLLAEAQINATLALAEQQRIANLIALSKNNNYNLATQGCDALADWHVGDDPFLNSEPEIKPEIRSALGMED